MIRAACVQGIVNWLNIGIILPLFGGFPVELRKHFVRRADLPQEHMRVRLRHQNLMAKHAR
ncbi:hypothetical protein DGI_2925 [Megalodesulfovibrio gigas DSM 1382 = ATCC 19364]|uniref:Uncharacterized protein n=1 Tax=Megalodesulfovibrio gigas (strain ATCC 19364 / DSM 1382 / NCIMB 9332 / VKM B-1759) TaxID=1121448 RepID=T2GDK4_MEGG1|nr:hypothetical protein DGI_2925 [Megalodesulfovibrio gigas DSM 1382 = ATCC 19364]